MAPKHMFSVYDSKATAYCVPFASVNLSTALRDFAFAANDPSSEINRHPLDYSLFQIGLFDDETGVLTPQTPLNLGMAAQFINKTEVTQDA